MWPRFDGGLSEEELQQLDGIMGRLIDRAELPGQQQEEATDSMHAASERIAAKIRRAQTQESRQRVAEAAQRYVARVESVRLLRELIEDDAPKEQLLRAVTALEVLDEET